MVKRHLNHEIAKLSGLIRDSDRIIQRKESNLTELSDSMVQLTGNFHVNDNLNHMSGQLNSLLSDLKRKSAGKDKPEDTSRRMRSGSPARHGQRKFQRPETSMERQHRSLEKEPLDRSSPIRSIHSDHSMIPRQLNDMNDIDDIDEFEEIDSKDEEPEELIHQLDGYIKSTHIPNKTPFNEILNSTHDLVNHLPDHGKGNKQLNEFLTSLESCIGAFT